MSQLMARRSHNKLKQLESQEVLPYDNIEFVKKTMKTEHHGDWTTLEADRTLNARVEAILEKLAQEAVSTEDIKNESSTQGYVDQNLIFLHRIVNGH